MKKKITHHLKSRYLWRTGTLISAKYKNPEGLNWVTETGKNIFSSDSLFLAIKRVSTRFQISTLFCLAHKRRIRKLKARPE